MPFTNVSGSGSTVNVRPPAPRAAPPPPPRVVANPDNQVQRSAPASSGYARAAHAIAVARANSGRPEGGPAALAGSSSAQPLPRNAGASPAARGIQGIYRLLTGGFKGPFVGPFASPVKDFYDVGHSVGQVQLQDLFSRDVTNLKAAGLMPKGANPSLAFDSPPEALAYTQGQTVHVSPLVTDAATATDDTSGRSWAREALVHELGHTMQRGMPPLTEGQGVLGAAGGAIGRALVEGGAQAFADAATPRVLGPQPIDEEGYGKYAQLVRRLGSNYYMRQQFGRK